MVQLETGINAQVLVAVIAGEVGERAMLSSLAAVCTVTPLGHTHRVVLSGGPSSTREASLPLTIALGRIGCCELVMKCRCCMHDEE